MTLLSILALTFATLLAALILMRRIKPASGSDRQIYLDQLDEIARDLDRGVLDQTQADAASLEIKRRLLASEKSDTRQGDHTSTNLFGYFAVLPILAALAYLQLGRPDLPAEPLSGRLDERAALAETNDLIAQLRARLAQEPNGGSTRGWVLLAQSLSNLERHQEAADAYDMITDRSDITAPILTRAAEAHVASQNGIVTEHANALITRALALDPQTPAGIYYRALYLSQNNAAEAAFDTLKARVENEDAFQPWMPSFLALATHIAQTTQQPLFDLPAPRGPSSDDINAARDLSAEDRREMIEGMVDQLADRLTDTPDDIAGFLRLGQSALVLDRKEQAIMAFERVIDLTKDQPDGQAHQAAQSGLAEAKDLP